MLLCAFAGRGLAGGNNLYICKARRSTGCFGNRQASFHGKFTSRRSGPKSTRSFDPRMPMASPIMHQRLTER